MDAGLFWWVRDIDETGMSGTGIVGQVAVFDDGSAVLRWLKSLNSAGVQSSVFYETVDDLLWVHGHGEKKTGHLVPVLTIGQCVRINSMEGFGGYAEVALSPRVTNRQASYWVKPLDSHQPEPYWAWSWEIEELQNAAKKHLTAKGEAPNAR